MAGTRQPTLILPVVDLSDDEWNAVILHELAHIRRRDYAMNRAVRGPDYCTRMMYILPLAVVAAVLVPGLARDILRAPPLPSSVMK